MTHHTTGPWTVSHKNGRYTIWNESAYTSAEIMDANARLIAAAPDLLQVLTEMHNYFQVYGNEGLKECYGGRIAHLLAQAEGRD